MLESLGTSSEAPSSRGSGFSLVCRFHRYWGHSSKSTVQPKMESYFQDGACSVSSFTMVVLVGMGLVIPGTISQGLFGGTAGMGQEPGVSWGSLRGLVRMPVPFSHPHYQGGGGMQKWWFLVPLRERHSQNFSSFTDVCTCPRVNIWISFTCSLDVL